MGFNHFDENGNAVMVDVSAKEITERIAVASGKIHVNREVMEAIVNHTAKKGDVLTVARVAGIMATKQTSNLIPMCHPLCLNKCTVEFEVDEENGSIQTWCTVKVSGKTGVEMEALMGVNVALLTIYDMCKAMDRAMEGGIDDVGIGVLFGLNTYRYDFVGLLMHAEHLEAKFGVGPHTISVPRICSADDIDAGDFPNAISDEIFSKIVAVIRIAVPYTGMIISTRESQESRKKVLELGISQISGGSRTSVGGYAEAELPENNSAQFDVSDTRTLDEVVNWLLELGYISSFCTACYREGRTGDRFMSLVKSGQIANCCGPNALMTLKEYLEDYASEDTRRKGLELISKETERIPNPKIREIAIRNLKDISEGKRDFRF